MADAATANVKDVVVPDLGDFADVPVIEVLVAAGDSVEAEQPLVTLESDKATMDVPAPFGGVVKELKVKVGDRVSEGSTIATIAVGDGEDEKPEEAAPSTEPAPEAGAQGAVETATIAERSAVAGDGAGGRAEAPPSPPAQAQPAQEPAEAGGGGGPAYASPGVRRLAHRLGVELSKVEGTGRKGRILKEDVEAFSKAPAAPASAPGGIPGLELAPWPQIDFAKYGPVEAVPLSRIKKISGPNLARNWVMIPHVTHNDEADITDLEAFRKATNEQYKSAQPPVKLTMVALLVKAVVASLKEFPEFNASLAGDELVLKRYYNIGFAADTPQGLVVPVIKDADQKGILQIAQELGELSGAAREGKLKSADMQGGTFTISSLGGIGGTSFSPIINAPEVAILGVTRSAMRPVWDGREFRPRLMVPLSLSYDHRIIDGAAAARFTAHLGGVLTDMRRALL